MSPIADARTSLALEKLNICADAAQAGWRGARLIRPGQELCSGAILGLGDQSICVRVVINTGDDAALLLERLKQDILRQLLYSEVFVILADYSAVAIKAYRAEFAAVRHKRVIVGSPHDFRAWLRTRLGPVGRLPLTSKLRLICEQMICTSSTLMPTEKSMLVSGDFRRWKTRKSFETGAEGVQAVNTLLSYALTRDNAVVNVESDPTYQQQGIDLLLNVSAPGADPVSLDVKVEGKYKENISLEDKSNVEDDIDGWLHKSKMEILATIFGPTGELFLMDFAEIKAWAFANEKKLKHSFGYAEGQTYRSYVWLAPANTLLAELDGIVRIRIAEWLPTLYAGKFESDTTVKSHLLHRTLQPQPHLDWLV